MMNISNGDGSAEEQIQVTNEHPDMIKALRNFRRCLFDWLEDMGAAAGVDLDSEGACTIQLGLGSREWGVLKLTTDETQ